MKSIKPLILFLLTIVSLSSFGQENRFSIQAKIVDIKGDPVSDVYIVNLVSNEKDISLSNGIFTINASAGDSLILSHISYFRKIVTVHSILLNPIIEMYSENVDIPEVRITPDQKSAIDRANQNMEFLNEYNPEVKIRLAKEEADPVTSIMTENNELMRSEASSLSLVRFSPSESIGKLFTKLKKKDYSNDYSSTKKQMEEKK